MDTEKQEKLNIAIVGADREGLELLKILAKDEDIRVRALIDPDKNALAFRLKEYGYTLAEELQIYLSSRLRDLTTFNDLHIVIDTVPHKYHSKIYDIRLYPLEVMEGLTARFLWELKGVHDIDYRRPSIKSRIEDIHISIREALKSIHPSMLIDEYSAFILRAACLGVHADRIRLSLLDPQDPSVVKKDLNVWKDMKVRKETYSPSIRNKHRGDELLKTMVEKREVIHFLLNDGELWRNITLLPILQEEAIYGILWLFYSDKEDKIREDDEAFLKNLLPQFASMIMEGLKVEQDEIQYIKEELIKLSLTISEGEEPVSARLKDINQNLKNLLRAEEAHLYVKDPSSQDLILQATTWRLPFMANYLSIKRGHGILYDIMEKKDPLILSTTGLPHMPERGKVFIPEDRPLVIYMPLVVKKKSVGIASMEFTSTKLIKPDIFHLLATIYGHLSSAIESDIERHRMTQKILKLVTINEEGIEILSTTDMERVLSITTSLASMIFDCEVSILHLMEDGALSIKATNRLKEDSHKNILLDIDRNLCDLASQTGIPIIINDIADYVDIFLPTDFPYRTAMVIPFFSEGQLSGILSLYNKQSTEPFRATSFTEDDKELIDRFIPYVVKGINNARQYLETKSLITIDPDTGLRNERYLQIRFPEEIKRAKRYDRKISLLFFEVRPFTQDILKDIANLVKDTFRYIDVIVRLKDAKFAILLPDTGDGVKEALKRLSINFEHIKEKNPDVKLYAGYSIYPDDSEDIQELIKRASKLQPCV